MANQEAAIPADMQELHRRLEEWRATHRPRSPLPDELWTMAVGLAQRHNIHRLRAPSPFMFVGYVRVSSETERQNSDLQRDALLAAGVDTRQCPMGVC